MIKQQNIQTSAYTAQKEQARSISFYLQLKVCDEKGEVI
jgi:hypothetical protein